MMLYDLTEASVTVPCYVLQSRVNKMESSLYFDAERNRITDISVIHTLKSEIKNSGFVPQPKYYVSFAIYNDYVAVCTEQSGIMEQRGYLLESDSRKLAEDLLKVPGVLYFYFTGELAGSPGRGMGKYLQKIFLFDSVGVLQAQQLLSNAAYQKIRVYT